MIPDFILSTGRKFQLKPLKNETNPEKILPGATTMQASSFEGIATIREKKSPLYSVGHRIFRFFKSLRLTIREKVPGIRLEAVLAGELQTVSPEGIKTAIKPGQYRISAHPEITALFQKNSACHYFIMHYSKDLLERIGIAELVQPGAVKPLTDEMRQVIQKILHNPFQEKIREFHHDNCIRELLRLHLTNQSKSLPDELSDEDIFAIYSADAIIQEDLTVHYQIPTLAQKVGINEFKLKQGFKKFYKMGVFQRLTWHRMEYAKELLQTTTRKIDDIAVSVGYSSRNSFVTAFKNTCDSTPKQWRKKC